ncbi:MAG: DUF934 domain-containing protein [Candidatus Accumulibacter sp.]|jgi:uncharacterized protein (DUF934 family)|nr:DUF934 domain-containing protein [Accumulibacter sp.]
MPRIIRNGRIVDDAWRIVTLADGETPVSVALPSADAIVPLSVWLARKDEIIARGQPVGVWLDGHEEPQAIAADLGHFALIAINFPKFADGRAYSVARLLRERHGYTGELRAIGDVLRDQLYFMKRCGFDAYAVRADKDIAAALAGLDDFPESYQAAADQPQPLFRRRSA